MLLGLALGASFFAVPKASAQPTIGASDFQLALLRYPGGSFEPRRRGLERLAWELRKRTSIAADLEVTDADLTSDRVFDYPLLVWQGDRTFPPFSERDVLTLRQYLVKGGTLLVDLSDALAGGPFDVAVRRELLRILEGAPLVRLDREHVLYKSFYLIDRHGGRVQTKPFLEGAFIGGRLAVIFSSNDLAGAMARDELGRFEYDVGQGGDSTREATFRLGINLVMYVLCLDYKDDQVHIPFILQRRR